MLILAKPPVKAWSLIANTSATSPTLVTTITTPAINTAASDLLVAAGSGWDGNPAAVMSDSLSNSWLTAVSNKVVGYLYNTIFYVHHPNTGSSHTFTYSGSATIYGALSILAFSGSSPSDPVLDLVNSFFRNSGVLSIQPGAVTPSQNNELIIASLGHYPDNGLVMTSMSVDVPYILTADMPMTPGLTIGGASAYQFQSIAGPTNPTWTWTPGYTSAAVANIACFLRG
jgi:hypothetical protein